MRAWLRVRTSAAMKPSALLWYGIDSLRVFEHTAVVEKTAPSAERRRRICRLDGTHSTLHFERTSSFDCKSDTHTPDNVHILVSGLYIKIYSRVYVVYTVVDMAVEEGRIDRHIVSSAAAQMLRSSSIITTSTSSGCSRHTNWFITPQKTPHHDFKIQIYTIFNTIYGS